MEFDKVKIGPYLIKENKRFDELISKDGYEVLGVSNVEGITKTSHVKSSDLSKYLVIEENYFAYNPYRINVGSIGLTPKNIKGIVSPAYVVFRTDSSKLLSEILLEFLKSKEGLYQINKFARGTVRKALRFEDLCQIEMIIPHIDVQKSIVKKQKIINTKKSILFNEFDKQQTLIKKLKQSILQDAIQGKLTEEWRNSIFKSHPELASGSQKSVTLEDGSVYEPASVLLQKIKAEKDKLIAEGKIKKGKKQTSNELNNNAITLPHHWCIVDLDDITLYITDGTHQTPSYTSEGKMFLSAQNVKPFKFMPEKHRCISEEAYQRYIKNRLVEFEDILIGRVGAGIGETAVVDKKLEFAIYVSLGLVKTFKKFSNPNYLAIVFNSPYGVKYSKGNISSGGGSAGNFNLGRIRSFPIPLPPLIEQKLIVEKLDKLMNKINLLEKQIEQNKTNAEMLIQAVLKEAFEEKS